MLVHIATRTEYSYQVFGSISAVVANQVGKPTMGIADIGGTWGHVQFNKYCKKNGLKPIFGVQLMLVPDSNQKDNRSCAEIILLAKNKLGLQELYKLVELSTEKFHYQSRIDYDIVSRISENIHIIICGCLNTDFMGDKPHYIGLSPGMPFNQKNAHKNAGNLVAICDNYYMSQEDGEKFKFQIVSGINYDSGKSQNHIYGEGELFGAFGEVDAKTMIKNNQLIADSCDARLEQAELFYPKTQELLDMCLEGAILRKIDLENPEYKARLEYELGLIETKKFEDYFFLVADICKYAKEHMLVGPGRGSSSGSLVCYLLNITDIDPLVYGLLFERFIDINRMDLPDIDIDFQDEKRHMVFDYLYEKFDTECVARLGSISRYKPKSALDYTAKALGISPFELDDLKSKMLVRSGGDARAALCLLDSINELECGKQLMNKFPELLYAAEIEAHASHTGQHAAGIVVSKYPITNYCAIDSRNGCAMVDKYDAEELNLLKIDCLGLRTLSIVQNVLDMVGKTRDWLVNYPVDDHKAFEIINKKLYCGIFQFEGDALQGLCKQMAIENFTDIVSITALARPGTLISGAANRFVQCRIGRNPVKYCHPAIEPYTSETYGVVIYQEQVMEIARKIGQLSWEDVSSLRKALSKSLGIEFFNKYYENFKIGANAQGIGDEDAAAIWAEINTMGSWAFNKSHAVSYGLMSYYCAVLKAYYPREFAIATLNNEKNSEQSVKLLRELEKEGMKFKLFDIDHPTVGWTINGSTITGGIDNIKGLGEKKAQGIIDKIRDGKKLTPAQQSLLANATTPYDVLWERRVLWQHVLGNPAEYGIVSPITSADQIRYFEGHQYVVLAKLTVKNQRDANEAINVKNRGYEIKGENTKSFNLTLEDDTGMVKVKIRRQRYMIGGLGDFIMNCKEGDWFLAKFNTSSDVYNVGYIQRMIKINDNPKFAKKGAVDETTHTE